MPRGFLEAACHGDHADTEDSHFVGQGGAAPSRPGRSPTSAAVAALPSTLPLGLAALRGPRSSLAAFLEGPGGEDAEALPGVLNRAAAPRAGRVAPRTVPRAVAAVPLPAGPLGGPAIAEDASTEVEVSLQPGSELLDGPPMMPSRGFRKVVEIDDGQGPREEVIEYWALQAPTVGRGRGRGVVVHQRHHAEHVSREYQMEEDPSPIGVQVLPRHPSRGSPAHFRKLAPQRSEEPEEAPESLSPPPPSRIIIEETKETPPGFQLSVLLGGTLALCAQAYLWGTVFVTLFKPQRPSVLNGAAVAGSGPVNNHVRAASTPPSGPLLAAGAPVADSRGDDAAGGGAATAVVA